MNHLNYTIMKTFVFNYSKFFILLAVAGGSVLFSAYGDAGSPDNPCYDRGTVKWDGMWCQCQAGFKGLCCEIESQYNGSEVVDVYHMQCRFDTNLKYKPAFYHCSLTITGDAELAGKLSKIINAKFLGDGIIAVDFNNFAYFCEAGRRFYECSKKDCSQAIAELIHGN